MQMQSLSYVLFLLGTALLCRWIPRQLRCWYLLAVSLGFYALADLRGLGVLVIMILWNYAAARQMEHGAGRKGWLSLGLLGNFGLLFLLKYLGFFAGLLTALTGTQALTLQVLLPAGISFYLFAASGYLVDVYRQDCPAEKNLPRFALFLSFFPSVLSGPIERAGHLLPQLEAAPTSTQEDWKEGALRFLVGLFGKLVIADQLAVLVHAVYGRAEECSWVLLLFTALAYALQIYCDFSAYSHMAIGSARLFGIRLLENFDRPYASTSVKEFWRRWHMSLSHWFRDYVYFPLGGSRKGRGRACLNVLLVFGLSGLWHGASLTFVVWGLLNGLHQIGESLVPGLQKLPHWLRRLGTFLLISLTWIFFRAESLSQAGLILGRIFTLAGGILLPAVSKAQLLAACCFAGGWMLLEAVGPKLHLWSRIQNTLVLRYSLYVLLICLVLIFGAYGSGYNAQDFLYFQF